VGTVVLVYPKGGYMVEFVDHEGNTLDLAEEEVEPLRAPPSFGPRPPERPLL
jgi:hypothetical protein